MVWLKDLPPAPAVWLVPTAPAVCLSVLEIQRHSFYFPINCYLRTSPRPLDIGPHGL